jgi:hypothetical protein
MRLRFVSAASLPLLAFAGCVLPSFKNVDEPAAAGSAGISAGAGLAEPAGEGGEAGSSNSAAPEPVDDVFSMLQGATLSIPAPGVLENDVGASLSVSVSDDSDIQRPAKYDASTLVIDADGSLTFQPQADFFGVYTIQYTVRDKDGVSASANVKVHVQPVKAKLASVRDGIGGFVIDGAAKDALGAAVATAGDVNKDGFDDVLLGAPAAGENGAGRAYVIYGRAKSAKVTLKALPAKSSERTFFGFDGADGDGLGNSVAGIGDLNGDGFSDFAVAASTAAPAGAVYVLYGGALSGSTALAGLSPQGGVTLSGDTVAIGALIGRAGDVNGDGIPDLLVSGASDNGRVYAVLGSEALQSATIDALPGLFQIEGDSKNEALPQSLDTVGHITNDALDEVVVASLTTVALLQGQNAAYPKNDGSNISTDGATGGGWRYALKTNVVPAVAGAGNVDGDAAGTDDILICEAKVGDVQCRVVLSPPVLLDDGWEFTGFGDLPKLAHGADLNADGFSDLVFADGAVTYVVFGKRSGHSPIDVTALGSAGFSLEPEAGEQVDSVATIGDVNGDHIADYAVGVSTANVGTGSVFVVFGDKY